MINRLILINNLNVIDLIIIRDTCRSDETKLGALGPLEQQNIWRRNEDGAEEPLPT